MRLFWERLRRARSHQIELTMYDFDINIDRANTDACKLELCPALFGTSDLIPLWIADMDFAVPPAVQLAVKQRVEHPVYGYTLRTSNFNRSIVNWQRRHNNWDVKAQWIGFCPGVVPALAFTIQALTQPGDGVIIQTPVYPPFFDVVRQNKRTLEVNKLIYGADGYSIDFDNFEALAAKPTTKLFMLCHPHNPIGKEWSEADLKRLADICLRHGVRVVADEIHADLMLFGHKHKPFASLSHEIEQNTITLMAASKTFNIAGFATSYSIIPNDELRTLYTEAQESTHIENNMLGCMALQAAYDNCDLWLSELLAYLSDNVTFATDYIAKNIPEIKVIKPEATFLLWLDFSALGLSHDKLRELLYRKARIGLNDGTTFAPEYVNHFRMNIASPQSVIAEALDRLAKAVAEVRK